MQLIHCDLHDYAEIVCLFRYELRIELLDGTKRFGTALTVSSVAGVGEQLRLRRQDGLIDIWLHEIERLVVLTSRALFREIRFAPDERRIPQPKKDATNPRPSDSYPPDRLYRRRR
ncbi:MAG: hypothetical protein Cons2KO_10130 [Congregibacter sp.]